MFAHSLWISHETSATNRRRAAQPAEMVRERGTAAAQIDLMRKNLQRPPEPVVPPRQQASHVRIQKPQPIRQGLDRADHRRGQRHGPRHRRGVRRRGRARGGHRHRRGGRARGGRRPGPRGRRAPRPGRWTSADAAAIDARGRRGGRAVRRPRHRGQQRRRLRLRAPSTPTATTRSGTARSPSCSPPISGSSAPPCPICASPTARGSSTSPRPRRWAPPPATAPTPPPRPASPA